MLHWYNMLQSIWCCCLSSTISTVFIIHGTWLINLRSRFNTLSPLFTRRPCAMLLAPLSPIWLPLRKNKRCETKETKWEWHNLNSPRRSSQVNELFDVSACWNMLASSFKKFPILKNRWCSRSMKRNALCSSKPARLRCVRPVFSLSAWRIRNPLDVSIWLSMKCWNHIWWIATTWGKKQICILHKISVFSVWLQRSELPIENAPPPILFPIKNIMFKKKKDDLIAATLPRRSRKVSVLLQVRSKHNATAPSVLMLFPIRVWHFQWVIVVEGGKVFKTNDQG